MQFLETSNGITSERDQLIQKSKTTQELHGENKRFINELMNSLSGAPEYNLTACKILKQTLKLPKLDRDRIKTEATSPMMKGKGQAMRSLSFHNNNEMIKKRIKTTKMAIVGKLLK